MTKRVRWGYWEHRRDLFEGTRGSRFYPFSEFKPYPWGEPPYDAELVLAAAEYGEVSKMDDQFGVIRGSSCGYGGEVEVDIHQELAEFIEKKINEEYEGEL